MARKPKSPKVPKAEGNQRIGLIALAIGLFSLLLYVNTTDHGFVLDDVSAITDNFVVQKGVDGIATIWKTHYRYGYWGEGGSLYRPLSLSLFAIQWEYWPDNPAPGHWTNILLYSLFNALLFILLTAWFGRSKLWLSLMACLLFAVHPLHTEVVANIKSADELLAGLFGLLSLIAVWKNGERWFSPWSLLASISFFLAMSSKESAITLIPLSALAVYYFKDKSLLNSAKSMVHFVLPTLVYFILRIDVLGGLTGPRNTPHIDNILFKAKGLEWFATTVELSGLYLYKMIFPHPLSHDYSLKEIPIVGLGDWQFWIAFVTIGLITFFGIRLILKKHFLGFVFLLFVCTYSLYSNFLLTIGTHFGERLMFLPSLAYSMVIAWLIWKWGKGRNDQFLPKKAILPIFTFGCLLGLYGFKTMERNQDWKTEFDLYSADVENAPNSCRTHYRLGMAMMKERALTAKSIKVKNEWLRKAVGELKKAVEIYPSYADAQGELGLAYQRLGYKDLAVERYNLALKYNPTHATTLNNLGAVMFEQGKLEKAAEYFSQALKKDPNYKDAIGNLASCYGSMGQYDEAIVWFKKAIDIDPRAAIYYYYIGVTYQRMGQPNEAQTWLNQAYVLDPKLKPKK